MSTSLEEQIKRLQHTIAEMESQRAVLGEDTVTTALVPLREKLAALEAQIEEPEAAPLTQQRKLATILFMDVVGSTEMTHHLDPEDQMELIDPLIARLAEKVNEFGGHVARFQGDGFKAVFGLPVARENDPEQAIRAGLTIQVEAAKIAAELEIESDTTEFKVRLGISTGLVFAGGDTEGEDTIKGDPVNLAARLESAAPPGNLLISHHTYRHVRGVFNVDPLEPIATKGFPEPVPVYLVREVKPRAFRVLTRGVEGVETRMVGRETDLKCLQDALLTAFEEGEGQMVTISGEAGVGKSRLLYEFDNWIELLPPLQDVRFFQGRGRQESQRLPYSLLRDLFAFRFQILDDDSGEAARRKIEAGFGGVFGGDDDDLMRAHILGQLLGFDFSASPHLKGVLNDAEQLRNRGLMYLVQYFQSVSQKHPVVIFLEDVHWGDDSSLDILNRLGEYTLQHPWLIVCAARPTLFERRPYWGEGQAYHTLLELCPLSRRESRQLVVEILKMAAEVPTDLRDLVVSGAEGNPFYTEELIKMLIEDGVIIPGEETWVIDLTRLEEVDVPPTLAGVLQARLDSLPLQERTVLQQASVVGRIFWDRIVSYIQAEAGNGDDPNLISHALTSLRNRELVYRHEESVFEGAVEYLFKHDVLREVTYESVLKRLRKNYHGLVADWLVDNSGDRIGEYSGLIANHLLLADKKDQACEYLIKAGEIALASYANAEAEIYYRQAIELSPQDSFLADLLTGLGEALWRQGNYEEAKLSWKMAIKIYRDNGNSDRTADVYARLSELLWDREGYEIAWNVCQEGLETIKGAPDSSGYARLLAEGGRTAFFSNANDQVIPLCERAIEMAKRMGDMEVQSEASITLAFQEDEDDPYNAIRIMEDVIAVTEAEGLLGTAARAHVGLGSLLGTYLIDYSSAYRHYLRAAQIMKQMGNIEQLILPLRQSCNHLIFIGKLKDAENWISEFLGEFAIPQSHVNQAHEFIQPRLLTARGDWAQSLELLRPIMEEMRKGRNYQQIAWGNIDLANTILELNRFGSYDDLAEVERMLKENIEISWLVMYSYFILAVVSARQKQFNPAQEYILQAENHLSRKRNNLERELRSRVELELALVEERWEDVIKSSEVSIEILQDCGNIWSQARRLIDLGDALIGRNEPGDLERARETYQQSLDMFSEMGAPGYIKVLEERLGNLSF